VTPASWPIGMGRDFLGTYDLLADAFLLFERGVHDRVTEPVRCSGLDDPQLRRLLPKPAIAKLRGGRDDEGAAPAVRPGSLSRGPS
jgi:peptide chain release factor 3